MTSTAIVRDEVMRRSDRVREHTAADVNLRIDRETQAALAEAEAAGRDGIVRRLTELDHEWDVDRALMLNFAILGGASFGIGMSRFAAGMREGRRRTGWLQLFGAQLGFLAMHAVAGWCPPLVVLRRLGYRTRAEIESERAILHRRLGVAA